MTDLDQDEARIGGAILTLAGDEPDSDTVEDAPLIRAWVLHQLIASAPTVEAVLEQN